MNLRFYIDPETDAPHIYRHGVDEAEVEDVLRRPIEGSSWTRGCPNRDRANTGRPVLAVVYVPDPEPDSVLVITAFDLGPKPLRALRRRKKKP